VEELNGKMDLLYYQLNKFYSAEEGMTEGDPKWMTEIRNESLNQLSSSQFAENKKPKRSFEGSEVNDSYNLW